MERKLFKDCQKGDTMYLLDINNNLELKKAKLKGTYRWYGEASFRIELANDIDVDGCLGGRSRNNNLFTTEEEALAFKAFVEKGEKVFLNLGEGDTIYVVFSGENDVKTIPVANITRGYAQFLYDDDNYYEFRISGKELENKTYANPLCWHDGFRVYLNEKDALKSIRDAERRQKKSATEKYIEKMKNHDGKPINLKDKTGADLHYGDKVAFANSRGSGSPFISIGKITGETKQRIIVEDIMVDNDKMSAEDKKHSVRPWSLILLEAAKANVNSGFILTK